MAIDRWITNLESQESMAEAVRSAESAVKVATTPGETRQAKSLLHIAKFKQADVARTMAQVRMETGGRFSVGPPMATQFRTTEEIAAQGIVGLYREGAGVGSRDKIAFDTNFNTTPGTVGADFDLTSRTLGADNGGP